MTEARRRERFVAVFEDHYGAVLAYLLRRTTPAQAEDAAAETFLIAWRRSTALPDDPLPWLYGVARKVLGNQRRGASRQAALLARAGVAGGDGAAPDPAEGVADRSAALAALGRLRADEQELLRLVAWEGLDPRRGAVVLGCSQAAFKVRVHRARRRLERELASQAAPGRRLAGSVEEERR